MLAGIYTISEGMNEKGLGVSILELETEEIHQDNGKPDLLLFIAARAILDRCATVDEAVKFLGQYDIHTYFEYPYHLFIADLTGKSAVVEWVGDDMNVLEANCVTNFQLSPGENYGCGIGQDRYMALKERLAETGGVLSHESAMQLLADVSIPWNGEWDTEWSCVYDLTNFWVDVIIDMDYSRVFRISR